MRVAERNRQRGALWSAAFSCVWVCVACAGAPTTKDAQSAPSPGDVKAAPAAAAHDAAPKCDPAMPVALSDAKSVVAKRCASCHSASGMAGEDYDWTKESALVAHRRNVAAQLAGNTMPPAGYPRPTPEERLTLFCWAQGQN